MLFLATTALADETVHFETSVQAQVNFTISATSCYGDYLAAPITNASQTNEALPISLPKEIWIAHANCEDFRTLVDQQYGSTSIVTFQISGFSQWETDRIGGGCYGHKCQTYVTYAELTGSVGNFQLVDHYSDYEWFGRRPYVAPAPTRPQPHPLCNPMALICPGRY